jgi:epsin
MSSKTATTDKPHSPSKSQLSKVAAQTHCSTHEYQETVDFLKRQLQCVGSKWRCCFKTLVVIEYLLHHGSERCIEWAIENADSIKTLELFKHENEKAEFKGKKATPLKRLVSLSHRLTCKKYSTICSRTGRTFAF